MAQLAVAGLTSLGVGATAANLIVGVAFTVIGQALTNKQSSKSASKPEVTTDGGQVPQSFIIGRAHTRGHFMVPHYAHDNGKYRVYVIQLSSMPITDLEGIYVDGTYIELAEMGGSHEFGVTPNDGDYKDNLWVRWHDGTQTSADSYLVDKFADHPDRPWTATAVSSGNAYMVVTCKGDRDVYQGEVTLSAVVKGLAIYDRRTGQTAYSGNPIVIAENIMRGISYAGVSFGMDMDGARLPASQWTEAANKPIAQYETGAEVFMACAVGGDYPLDVVDRFLVAANARIADVAGDWHVQVGVQSLPVRAIDATEYLRGQTDSYSPIRSVEESYNACRVTFTSPNAAWESKTARVRVASGKDEGERLRIADLDATVIQSNEHAQKVSKFYARDALRRRTIAIPLEECPDPFKAVAITDTVRGWSGKLFEVSGYVEGDGMCLANLREIDPTDNDDAAEGDLDQPEPVSNILTLTRALRDFNAVADVTSEGKPVIRTSWDGDAVPYREVAIQMRRAGQTDLIVDTAVAASEGKHVIRSLRGGRPYEVRARGRRKVTPWTGWVTVTTAANAGLSSEDLTQSLAETIDAAQADAQAAAEAVEAAVQAAEDAQEYATEQVRALQAQADDALLTLMGRIAQLSADDTIQTAQQITYQAEAEDAYAGFTETISLLATDHDALVQVVTNLTATVGDNGAAIEAIQTAYVNADAALAQSITDLNTYVTNSNASVSQSLTALSNEQLSMAQDITNLTTTVGQNAAAITQNAQAITTATQAAATATNNLRAEVVSGVASSLPSTFEQESTYFTTAVGGGAVVDHPFSGWSFPLMARGRVARLSDVTQTPHLYCLGLISPEYGRTYRVKVRARTQGDVTASGAHLALTIRDLDNTFANAGTHLQTTFATLTTSFVEYEVRWTAPDSGTLPTYIRGGLYARSGMTGTGVLDVLSIEFADVTDAVEIAASVEIQAQALAELSGQASAFYGVTVQTVGGVAGLYLNSFADPDGTGAAVAGLRGDAILLEGSVGTSLLNVGVGGNMIPNAGCNKKEYWKVNGSGGVLSQTAMTITSRGGSYASVLYGAVMLYQNGTATDGAANAYVIEYDDAGNEITLAIPVVAGEYYELSAQVSMRSCTGEIFAYWYDAAGNQFAQSPAVTVPTNGANSSDIEAWPRYGGRIQAPANAAFMRPYFRKFGTNSGSTASRATFYKPQVKKSHAAATAFAPWTPGGYTRIADGEITTNMLTANCVTANEANFESLSVLNLTVGTTDITNQAIYADRFYTMADVEVIGYSTSSRLTVFNETITDFEGGGCTVHFVGHVEAVDSTHNNSYVKIVLLINDTVVATEKFGADIVGGTAYFAMPANLVGKYRGTAGSLNIKVRAFNVGRISDSPASGAVYLRNNTVVVSGGRR